MCYGASRKDNFLLHSALGALPARRRARHRVLMSISECVLTQAAFLTSIGRKELGACSLDIPYGRLWVQSNADGLGDRVIERLVHCGALVTKDVPVTVGAHLPDRLTEVGAYVHSGNVIRGEVGVLRDLFQASLEGGALGVEFLGGGRWVSGQQDAW